MGVDTSTTTNVTCDNPNCPDMSGLDPSTTAGWLFVSHEIYGEPTQQHVFCCSDCLGHVASDPTLSEEFGLTKKEEETPAESTAA